MNSKRPKVSVIVPAYNHGKYVGFFIESVLKQTLQDFELVIIDDNSRDDTVKEIEKYKDKRIKLIKNDFNKGVNSSLTGAFPFVEGQYCTFSSSDDMLFPNLLEYSTGYLDQNPGKNVIYCALQAIDENGKLTGEIYKRVNRSKYEILRESFFSKNPLISPGMTVRRQAIQKLMPLNKGILQRQDYKMHVDLLLNGDCHITETPLIYYRVGMQNISRRTIPVNNTRDLEEEYLMDSFLAIDNTDTLERIFGKDLHEAGKPVKETIPYFLGRMALKSDNEMKKAWGYRTIMRFINEGDNQELLYKLYGFEFKNFIALVKYFENSRLSSYIKKIKKYRKLLRAVFVLLILSLILNVISIFII